MSLGLVSALALSVAFGCSSKKSDDTGGTGGAGFVCTGSSCTGDSGPGGSSGTTLLPNYCNGLLSGQTCSQTNLQSDVRTVQMLLVIDESGSMHDPPSATDPQTKWAEMTQALSATLPTYQDNINFGLELFPYDPNGIDITSPSSSCNVPSGDPNVAVNVPIAAGASNLTAITQFVAGQTPAGGTPTAKALAQAYAYFTQGDGKALPGSKWILLATDGGPNCNSSLSCGPDTCTQNLDGKCGDGTDPNLNCCDTSTASGAAAQANLSCLDQQAVVTQITQLKAAGVQTYVIGIPGSEAYATTLDAMANAGGVPNTSGAHAYYAVSGSNALTDLQTALNTIITQLVKTCDVKLNDSPLDLSKVQTVMDCQLVPALPNNKPPAADSGVQDGFYIDYSQSPAHVVLTGTYCNRIMTVGATHLDVIEGCIGVQ